MKKSLIFVLSIILLCCGCSASYSITINEDLSVTESAKAMKSAEFFNQYKNSSAQRVIGFLLEPHLEYLNNNGFTVDNVLNNDEAGVLISNEYESIEEYLKVSEFPQQYGDKIQYTENDGKITLRINGEFSDAEQDQSGKYVIDNGEISITLPNRTVVEHNADIVDEEINKYTWKIEDNGITRELYITFNKDLANEFPLLEVITIVVVIILIIVGIFIGKMIVSKKESRNKL